MGATASKRSDNSDGSSIVLVPTASDATHTDSADDTAIGAPGPSRMPWYKRLLYSCRRSKVTPAMIAKKRNTMRKIQAMARMRKMTATQINTQIAGLKLTMKMVHTNPQIDTTAKQMTLAQLGGWLAAATKRAKIEQTSFNQFLRQHNVAASHLAFYYQMQQTQQIRDGYEAIADGMGTANADAARIAKDLKREVNRIDEEEEKRNEMLDDDDFAELSRLDMSTTGPTADALYDTSAMMDGIMAEGGSNALAMGASVDAASSSVDEASFGAYNFDYV